MENNKVTFHHDLNTSAQRENPQKNDFPQKHSHSKYNFVPLSHQQILQHGLKVPAHQHGVNLNQSACPQSNSQSQWKPPHVQQNTQRYQQPPKQVNIQPSEPDQQQYAYLQHYQNSKSANIQSMPQSSPSSPSHAMVTNSYHHLTENAPQIWVPHQRPVHYHCQTTNEQKSQNSSPQIFSGSKTKDDIVEKKKLSGNPQLKSPSAKRPPEAPVTRQGWLHKQGSEMLMLWKKRWFVLSEYCLFYYKGPEEEKLLGSILLPSYSVSVCSPEDKVNRKYAFKCEHDNMRTYILAADSHETMMLWIHDLNLACLLQNNSENDQQSDKFVQSASLNQSVDSRDQYSQNCKLNFPPVHVRSSSNMIDMFNQSQQELSQQEFNQPLYANAPPKPRRLTYDGGCSSPSSCEALLDYTYQNKNSPCNIIRNAPKSDTSDFRMTNSPEYILQHHIEMQDYNMSDQQDARQNECHNFERRTPDTYSRSRINSSRVQSSTDYEDIYADQAVYKRPLSPIAYSNTKKSVPTQILNPLYRCYISDPKLDPKNLHNSHNTNFRNPQNVISRPHSADFLEYELNHQHKNSVCAQKPRPKSSLGINGNYNDFDNYFYSEEKYAEKMRKSSQYLPKMLRYYCQSPCTVPCQWTNLRYAYDKNTFPPMRSDAQLVNNCSKHHVKNFSKNMLPQRSKSVLSDSSLSKEFDMDDKMSYSYEEFNRELRHPGSIPRQEIYSNSGRYQECDPFTRSVSARLTPETYHMVKDGMPISREGYKKREESMKRLLEWKQRMLQSPLNRKVQNNRNYVNKDNYYKGCGSRYMHNGNQNMYQVAPRSSSNLAHYNSCSSDDEASGSMSINTREMFPRTMGYTRHWMQNSHQSVQSESVTNLSHCNDDNIARPQQPGYYVVKRTSQADTSSETDQKEIWPEKMNVSAGELLGRTHEELVLLLIQLRRQSSYILNAIEYCYNEIEKQPQLQLLDHAKRMENLQKLEQIKQHLIELEKQYEKGKPLINLVDNMVKLGSLYRTPNDRNYTNSYLKDRLEFSQQVQEKRLLDEERRDWNRLNPSHLQLQEKVQQLYHLDRLINDESRILQNLQQDKEDIEKALGELQYKLNMNKNLNNPTEVEQAQKQQIILENELGQVHDMLAQNSRKLEETVAGNARLEQELLVFKQKLQISRQQRSSPQFSNAGDSLPCIIGTSAMLESDLQKVQQKVGDLQKQRQELSMQVRQLTDRSSNHLQQMKQSNSEQNIQCLGTKKKMSSVWRETDLDTMNITDHGENWDINSSFTPLYINTDLKQNESDFYNKGMKSSDDTSDDTMQNTVLTSHEKQEIKTVRIVKRESERRQRDREKITTGKWDPVIEEDDCSQSSSISFRPATISKTNTVSDMTLNVEPNKVMSSSSSNLRGSLSSPNSPQAHYVSKATSSSEGGLDKSPELSPVFKSETARQIITEMSFRGIPKQTNKRLVPKEKRRHYTAPHNNQIVKSIRQFPTSDSSFDNRVLEQRRARDDLDMERALRQRIDAPDVVRSTLSNKELKYNERTIDNILGTPNKITIPERYIPEQLPQLTAEEQEQRSRKVESIKKMLSDTTVLSSSSVGNLSSSDDKDLDSKSNKVSLKIVEEKKQREHLLQLNQILAKQVMEMSKIVAGSNNVDDNE